MFLLFFLELQKTLFALYIFLDRSIIVTLSIPHKSNQPKDYHSTYKFGTIIQINFTSFAQSEKRTRETQPQIESRFRRSFTERQDCGFKKKFNLANRHANTDSWATCCPDQRQLASQPIRSQRPPTARPDWPANPEGGHYGGTSPNSPLHMTLARKAPH